MPRRRFCGIVATSLATAATSVRHVKGADKPVPPICVYTEHFQELPIPEVCRVFKTMDVQGLDLTVRPGGHIAPKDVQARLPEAAKAARDQGLAIMMLTTNITSADREATEILATCREVGIDRIKLGYFPVGDFGKLTERMDFVRRQLDAIATLAAQYGVRPCVHIHAGPTLPSNGFMLYELIRQMPPDRIGAYLDSYHMTLTGGAGDWKQAIDLLRPWISLVALKNFQWEKAGRDEAGQQRWQTNYCRLEDGLAPIPDFVKTVHESGYRGFYTLHTEYRLPVNECIRLTTEDHAYLRRVFDRLS